MTTPQPGGLRPGGPRTTTAASPRVTAYGTDAVLVELPDLRAVRALDARLRVAPPAGVVDVVPAARTVLVRGDARTRAAWAALVAVAAARAAEDDAPAAPARTVEIPVVYDGEDLEEVARLTGTGVDEVVARHLAGGAEGYRVAFGGFMPGFAYLVGLDPRLHVPRLDSPRTRVPAGSVAVAGEFTAVYPAATPGGWRILGRTGVALFDVGRGATGAALLAPGDVVRFVRAAPAAVRGAVAARVDEDPASAALLPVAGEDGRTPAARPSSAAGSGPAGRPVPTDVAGPAGRPVPADLAGPAGRRPHAPPAPVPPRVLTVVAPGPLALVEDRGRPGLAAVGVPRSGAADPEALARANRLVGNARDAAGLEVLLGGLVVTFGATTAIALTGADVPADLDGTPVPLGAPVRAVAGATLTLGAPVRGLRTWLAVRGGLDVPGVLGSCSRDVLSGLGPQPLRAGDVLAYGARFDGLPDLAAAASTGTVPAHPASAHADTHPRHVVGLPALPGPRLDHLDDVSRARLWQQAWDVTADSNRVAVRLDGPALARATAGELASEGLVLGAVQVPHDGRPVVFGPDHPVTGGYPVVAVLTAQGVAAAAQLRPGDRVRLTPAEGEPGGGAAAANHPSGGT